MKLMRFRSRSAALNLTLVLGVMTHSLSSSVSLLSGPSSMGRALPRGCTYTQAFRNIRFSKQITHNIRKLNSVTNPVLPKTLNHDQTESGLWGNGIWARTSYNKHGTGCIHMSSVAYLKTHSLKRVIKKWYRENFLIQYSPNRLTFKVNPKCCLFMFYW